MYNITPSNEAVLLVDNGSSRPDATLNLRRLAQALSDASGRTVHPVSLQHADRIEANRLGGLPALTFASFIRDQIQRDVRHFRVVPLFFGRSRALTSYIPDQTMRLREEFGPVTIEVADELCPLPTGEPRLARILYDHVRSTAHKYGIEATRVVLVDHGSPLPAVTTVREHAARELGRLLGDSVELAQAVMERRSGSDFDFNGSLLETQLNTWAELTSAQPIILAMMFLSPGRHAGHGGDVEQICAKVTDHHPDLAVRISPLVATHPLLIDVLKDRLTAPLHISS